MDARCAGDRVDTRRARHAGGGGRARRYGQRVGIDDHHRAGRDATERRVPPIFGRSDLQPPLTFTYPLDGSVGGNTVMMGRGEQTESSRARWNGQTLIIVTTFHIADRGAGRPFTAELTRKLWLESPTTLVVEVTRAGVLGGPASTTRSVYRKG